MKEIQNNLHNKELSLHRNQDLNRIMHWKRKPANSEQQLGSDNVNYTL